MKRNIKKVAVLGSGTMGSRIACHFANIGLDVVLLDIVPDSLTEGEQKKGRTLKDKDVRNRIVNQSLQTAIKSNPSPLYHPSFKDRITTGNFDDNMSEISQADWILEAVVENIKIKKSLFDKVEKFRKNGTLITTNTSGIPINTMLEGRSEDFKQNFCGTHFFNPPRYLKLLEVIPSRETKKEVVDYLMHFGDLYLGKETVQCKDTPAFIANRIGVYATMSALHTIEQMGLKVGEVDRMTGPLIGRPKSATFRTLDLVGIDTMVNVAGNLHQGLQDDQFKDNFKLPESIKTLHEKGWLGEKSEQGFFKKTRDDKGEREILEIDLNNFEYQKRSKANYKSLDEAKPINDLGERLRHLLHADDQAGEFYRKTFYDLFQYCSFRIPEIADELYQIDQAICAGFGWQAGPFATWDHLGIKDTVDKMEKAGYKVNQWVKEMITAGFESFYKIENGTKKYYQISSQSYQPIPGIENYIILDNIRTNKVLWHNEGASVFDLGDGVLNLEFHTKMNTLDDKVIEGLHQAIDRAEKDYRALIIGNQADNYSAGANLSAVFMYAVEQEYKQIDELVNNFQQALLRIRYSGIPIVSAPHGLTLGGGCELTMHADRVQAAAESYIGLVEAGVGLIPAGGGCKELAKRIAEETEKGDVELNVLQNVFTNVAMAKVATSAHEAFDYKYLQGDDEITINNDRLLRDAKNTALLMADEGYVQPPVANKIRVQGKTGIALFRAGIKGMAMGNYITEHDQKIADKLAWVMCGGDLSFPQEVPEQYLLDLEREAFLSLTGERKTLERIETMLQKGRPVRN